MRQEPPNTAVHARGRFSTEYTLAASASWGAPIRCAAKSGNKAMLTVQCAIAVSATATSAEFLLKPTVHMAQESHDTGTCHRHTSAHAAMRAHAEGRSAGISAQPG